MQRASRSPALLRCGLHRRHPAGLVSQTPSVLGSTADRIRCRADATLAGVSGDDDDDETDDLEAAVEVDVLVEGDPLPNLRCVQLPGSAPCYPLTAVSNVLCASTSSSASPGKMRNTNHTSVYDQVLPRSVTTEVSVLV